MARTKGTSKKELFKRDGLIIKQFNNGIAVKRIAKHWCLCESAVYYILSTKGRKV